MLKSINVYVVHFFLSKHINHLKGGDLYVWFSARIILYDNNTIHNISYSWLVRKRE